VEPGEIVPEEIPSDFEFDIRNYIKLSTYYDDLKDDPVTNPDNILKKEDYGFLAEINTQFEVSYLEDYQFKADVGFQYNPGPGEQEDADTHFILNESFFDFFIAQLAYLKIGKKRETWGVGWTFSPVDDVVDWAKNPVDPSDIRSGKYLAMLEIPAGDASFSFIYFPDVEYDLETETGQAGIPKELDFENPSLGARALFLLWDTDIAFIYNRTDKIPDLEKDYFGTALNRYWGDLGTYIEISVHEGNDMEFVQQNATGQYYFPTGDELVDLKKTDNDIIVDFAVGINYSFPDSSKIAFEYLRNGDGYNDDEFEEFYEFLENDSDLYLSTSDENIKNKLLKANQILGNKVRQNYLSFTFDRPFTFDDFNPHLGTIINLDDGSYLLNGAIEYAFRDDTSITLDMKWYIGDDDTEYGLKPDNFRAFLKLVYYF
ncbi:MAG: hypothetical protein HKO91_06560, partial [Desulfobacterales bacterium]|nr:hypothetical protein [Desulfobacterales bacterium]